MSVSAGSPMITVVLALLLPAAVNADIISDITGNEGDEFSALQIKAELFWKPIKSAAEEVNMEKHLELHDDAEKVINDLPAENTYVRQVLREALDHLKRADDLAFKQALASSQLAKEKLDAPCDTNNGFSFLSGGHFKVAFKAALKHFVGGGRYSEKLVEHVEQRQADVLPVLRGGAGVTGNVLSDCRLASKKGFDVRKYDIYNRDVPKTPKVADDVADRIIDAAGETRRYFTKGIMDLVKGITRDVQEKQEDAAVTVTKASLQGFHSSIAKDSDMLQKAPMLQKDLDRKAEAQRPSKGSILLSSSPLELGSSIIDL